ncbi:MAG: DUF2852 domain-containing protein [Pseudomonadota bacterium]
MNQDNMPVDQADTGIPVAVQVLSTLFFGVVGILAIIFAFDHSLVGGIIVAAIIAWRGGVAPGTRGTTPKIPTLDALISLAPEAQNRASGNRNFDAYRANTLRRLEEEQDRFQNFLDGLRAAKDKSEFNDFLAHRAERVANTANQ